MKKLIFAALLSVPIMASAGFVDDCKTAYVSGDLGVKVMEFIGGSTDQDKAEKPFQTRCSCIASKVRSEAESELFLDFIQNRNNLFLDTPSSSVKLYVTRSVRQCETEVSKKERDSFVNERQRKIDACLEKEIVGQEGTAQDKIYARQDIKYMKEHDGDWNGKITEEHFRGRDIASKAVNRCY